MAKISIRQRLSHALSQELAQGRYGHHQPIPTEADLSKRFSASRGTVRQALADLERQGLIYRVQGRGTFAIPPVQIQAKPLAILLREPHKAATPFISDLVAGVHSYVSTLGTYMVITNSLPSEWTPGFIESIGGVLVIPRQLVDSDLAMLQRLKIPYLLAFDSDLQGPSIHLQVRQAAHMLTQKLIDCGHRKIALISGHFEHSDHQKKQGIAEVIESTGLRFSDIPDISTNYDPDLAWKAAHTLLSSDNRPTAIIAFDDSIAMQVIRVAAQMNIRVPKDLSIVGFNDFAYSALVNPPLSTVRFSIQDAGYKGAEQLYLARVQGAKIRNLTLPFEIKWRASTAPAPH